MITQPFMNQYARSIESGWLGKVVGLQQHDGETFLVMRGVNMLCRDMLGGHIDDHLDADDVQWFTPEDVRPVKELHIQRE